MTQAKILNQEEERERRFCPKRVIWQYLKTFLVIWTGEEGCFNWYLGAKARDAGKTDTHPHTHTPKELSRPKYKTAEVSNPWAQGGMERSGWLCPAGQRPTPAAGAAAAVHSQVHWLLSSPPCPQVRARSRPLVAVPRLGVQDNQYLHQHPQPAPTPPQ